MAANTLGGLIVRLGLDAVDYFSGLTKAEHQARTATASITRSFNQLKGAAAALGVGLSANAFKDMILGAFDAQEELSNLGKRAGLTGSQLSSLTTAAKLTHTGLEDVAGMSAKLSKALLEFGKESSKSTIVLKALGLSAKDVPALLEAPAEAVLKFAKLIDSLPEGGTKAAAQLLILGKSGGTTSAFLAELATQTKLVATRTDEEIEAAKAFNDKLVLLGISTDSLKTKFANSLLPTLTATVDTFTKLTTGAGSAQDQLNRLKSDGSIQEWARTGAIAVGTLAESLIFVARLAKAVSGSFKVFAADIDLLMAKSNAPSQKITGAFGFSADEAAKGEAEFIAAQKRRDQILVDGDQNYVDLINKNATFITDAQRQSFEMQDRVTQAGVDALQNSDKNDRLNAINNQRAADAARRAAAAKAAAVQAAVNAGNAGKADDPSRNILEGQIRALEASIARERDILQARESFLRDSFTDGFLSVSNYYTQLQEAREANLQHAITAYNQEIAATKAFKDKLIKESERQAEQNKIDDIREKQAKLIRDAGFAEQALSRDRSRATDEYTQQLDELNAKMRELEGNTAAAAAIRFDAQTESLRRLLESSGNTGALAKVAAIREQGNVQARLNDESKKYQLIVDRGAIAQERINIARESGAIGELEALARTSAANKALLPLMQARIDALAEIAAKSQDPADLLKVEQLRVAMERLGAQTDLVKDKFNNIFSGAFSDAIAALADGTKSFKDAAKDLGKSIASQINKIAADEIAGKLFGKDGPLSGIGGIFSKLFGGEGAAGAAGGAAGAASTAAAATALTGSATVLTAAAAPLTAAGGTLAGAGGTIAGAGGTLAAAGATLTASGATLAASGGILTAAGAALTAAAAALTASAATSAVSSLAGAGAVTGAAFGFAAHGSNFTSGGPYVVGESGREIVVPPRGAQIIPNDLLMAKRDQRSLTININQNVMPGATTQSAMQAANFAGQQVRRAVVRNG